MVKKKNEALRGVFFFKKYAKNFSQILSSSSNLKVSFYGVSGGVSSALMLSTCEHH